MQIAALRVTITCKICVLPTPEIKLEARNKAQYRRKDDKFTDRRRQEMPPSVDPDAMMFLSPLIPPE